ncbi:hypothetical protein TeGR_g3356 [Tetraparma gracilis]|uniref:Protein kinase domain-containing protein n=1 Tax=Tetraparma gracilis TaxID=2962635 RepID=A0ABQ6MFD9_9STRA|nr:hypothetical protein TeGR_g3356 [Tetraparma gracilis]
MLSWITGATALGGLPYSVDASQPPHWSPPPAGFFVPRDGSPTSAAGANPSQPPQPVTIWTLDKASTDPGLLPPLRNHFSYALKLRHPGVLQVFEAKDTVPDSDRKGELIIVTQRCVPLPAYLSAVSPPSPALASFGLHSLLSALAFLHDSANLSHNNLHPGSVFVAGGEFKLSCFQLASPLPPSGTFRSYEASVAAAAGAAKYRSPERQRADLDAVAKAPVHCQDA